MLPCHGHYWKENETRIPQSNILRRSLRGRVTKFTELTHCFFSLSVRCQTLSPSFPEPIYAQCIQPISRAVSLCALPAPIVPGGPPVSVTLLAVPALWKRFSKPVRACCRRDGPSIKTNFSWNRSVECKRQKEKRETVQRSNIWLPKLQKGLQYATRFGSAREAFTLRSAPVCLWRVR